ncbi:MAG: Ycf66 family protein [Cyanobacteria bacterium]|nr:Ycf66 family protein [Cyanobacteriota bacterium]
MNFGTPVPLLIGLVLIMSAIALFFLDKLKPGYERDSDKVYAGLLLLSGVFLLGHLTMDLIPAFQQMLMSGMLIALLLENIRSRTSLREGGRQEESRPPARGDSRSSRRVYRAELDDYGPRDDRWDSPRIEASRDRYPDELDNGYRRQPSEPSSSPMGRLNPSSDRIRRRRPRTPDNRYGTDAVWDENPNPRRSLNQGEDRWGRDYDRDQPPSRNDYREESGQNGGGYANYQPINGYSDQDREPSTDY